MSPSVFYRLSVGMFASRDFECGRLLLLQARLRAAADAIRMRTRPFCVSFEASKKRLHTARQRVMIGGKEVVLPVGSYTASYVEKKVAEESQVGEPEQSPSGSQEKGWKKAFKKVKLVEMATDGGLSQNARTRARPVSAACTFDAALHAFDAARTLLSMTTYIFGRLMLLSCLPLCGGTGTPL